MMEYTYFFHKNAASEFTQVKDFRNIPLSYWGKL